MSQQCIPSSKMATRYELGSGAYDHHPVINTSSTKVVSARERRERLLAYHVAVKLLEDAGARKRRTSSPAKSDISTSPYDATGPSPGLGSLQLAVPRCSSRPFFPDPVVERVQRAVEAYEQQHGRELHDAISLDFVDANGEVILSPASSPKSSVAASSPRHGVTPHHSGGHQSVHSHGDHRKLPLPGRDIMEKVKSIFDSGGFSYFEDRRRELLGSKAYPSSTIAPSVRGGMPPPNEHAVAAMLQAVQGSSRSRRPTPTTAGGKAKPMSGLRGLHGKRTPRPLDAPLLHAQGQPPADIDVSRLMAMDEAAKQESADAAQRARKHAHTVSACIAAAVHTHLAATAGGKMRFTRRRSDAIGAVAGCHLRAQPSPPLAAGADEGATATARVSDMSQYCTVEEWLAHHPSIHDAVSATVDLLLLVLMKALPACLLAGDEERFTMLLEEERAVLMASAQLTLARAARTASNSKPPQAQDLKLFKPTPPLPGLGLSSTPRLLGATDEDPGPSGDTALDVLEAVDTAMIGLQLRASQRTERALSTMHANRLFLLIEVEQSMLGNNVMRLLEGQPLASVGVDDERVASRVGGRASPSRGTSAGSAASPRRVEKIELERERRKREASRPPKDPLQAVATSKHCWLSLTTARLRQLPFHACRDRVVAMAAGIDEAAAEEDDAPPMSPCSPLVVSPRELVGLGLSAGSVALGVVPMGTPGCTSQQLTPRLEPRPPPLPAGAHPTTNRTTSASVWSRRSASSASAEPDARPNQAAAQRARNVQPASASQKRNRPKTGPSGEEASGFCQPEPTILPIADVISVLNDPSNYERTEGGADGGGERFAPRAGTKLQDVVGPVELRLLLDVSTAYAALVQSLHNGGSGTSYARFLERNRDQLLRSASDVIVHASIEYLDCVISSPDGRRGLPRPSAPAARDAHDGDVESDDNMRHKHDAKHAAPYKGLLASLRPFGKKTELTKAQADAVLAASAQSGSTGGLMVGNEHDAQRAAQHLMEQNRAVLHEVLARVKGEVQFLLTGVDGRDKILEEEQIAIERQRQTRKAMRKLREARSTSPASQTAGAQPDTGSAATGAAAVGHHHALAALASHHHRWSLRFAAGAVVKGSDIVGQTNETRFRAMLNEMVGSSSEEEEVRQEAAYEAHDIMRPVFDWQRQNFSRRSTTRRPERAGGEGTSKSSAPPIAVAQPSPPAPHKPREDPREAAAPPTATSPAAAPLVAPPAPQSVNLGRNSVATAGATSGATARGVQVSSLSTIDLGATWRPLEGDGTKGMRRPTTTALATSIEMDPLPSHLSPTAASTSRTRLVQSRLAKRQQDLFCSSVGEDGLEASAVISPRSEGGASQCGEGGGSRQLLPARLRVRTTHIISPRSLRTPTSGCDAPTAVRSAPAVDATGVSQAQQRRRSSTAARTPGARTGSGDGPTPLTTGGATEDNSGISKLTGRMNKLRYGLRGGGSGSISVASGTSTASGLPAVLSDKSRSMVRASEGLSMVDLQRELVVLERNRRRSGRSAQPKPPPPLPNEAGNDQTEEGQADDAATPPPSSTRGGALSPDGVTASVVGRSAAATVEKFKKACGATIQHFYGALDGTEGTAWYEQGRPCAAARSVRVAAIRGVQQGRFDLSALTPIAALRLAVATSILDGSGGEALPSTLGGGGASLSGAAAPALVYPRLPNRTAGGDLYWTL